MINGIYNGLTATTSCSVPIRLWNDKWHLQWIDRNNNMLLHRARVSRATSQVLRTSLTCGVTSLASPLTTAALLPPVILQRRSCVRLGLFQAALRLTGSLGAHDNERAGQRDEPRGHQPQALCSLLLGRAGLLPRRAAAAAAAATTTTAAAAAAAELPSRCTCSRHCRCRAMRCPRPGWCTEGPSKQSRQQHHLWTDALRVFTFAGRSRVPQPQRALSVGWVGPKGRARSADLQGAHTMGGLVTGWWPST
eukprot:COSAG06_NODE_8815_length_2064_cov_3.171501_3_plen_250_part_00